ncbi:hypothetical protein NDU88_004995, partial [Pleurodeles waltl]
YSHKPVCTRGRKEVCDCSCFTHQELLSSKSAPILFIQENSRRKFMERDSF